MIRNVIFDWSGTLVDDLPAVWRATNHVLRQAGAAELTLDQFRAEFRLPFSGFYDRFTPHVPMARLEEWFHAHFREAQDSVEELPHARRFLEFCRAERLRTFVLSTVREDHFLAQCERTGFGEFLDHRYLGVWDKRDRIHELLAGHGLKQDETLYVGDMEHDIETARHGGVLSCAVLTGYTRVEYLRRSGPDLIVEHLGELRETLERDGLRLARASDAAPPPNPQRPAIGAAH